MAISPVLTVGDGVIEIPQELRNDPRLQRGVQLRLVSAAEGPLLVGVSHVKQKAKGDWRKLRGSLKHLNVRLTDEMEADKQSELAADERMMRGTGQI